MIFPGYLHFPDFFQVWKISGQISRPFQGFKTLYEPWLHYIGDNHEELGKRQPSLWDDPDCRRRFSGQTEKGDLPDKVLKHHHQTILRTGLYGKVRVQEGAKHQQLTTVRLFTVMCVNVCKHKSTCTNVTPKTKKETEGILYLMQLVAHE